MKPDLVDVVMLSYPEPESNLADQPTRPDSSTPAIPCCCLCDHVAIVQDSEGAAYCSQHAPNHLWDDTSG